MVVGAADYLAAATLLRDDAGAAVSSSSSTCAAWTIPTTAKDELARARASAW